MFVFGGYDNQGSSCCDLFSLDLSSFAWSSVSFSKDASCAQSFPVNGIMHHTANLVRLQINDKQEDCMLIFGGTNAAKSIFNSVLGFKFSNQEFFELKTSIQAPQLVSIEPRFSHSTVVTGSIDSSNFKLHVIGGVTKRGIKTVSVPMNSALVSLDLKSLTWAQDADCLKNQDSFLDFSKAVAFENESKQEIVVCMTGGLAPEPEPTAVEIAVQKKALKVIEDELPHEILQLTLCFLKIKDLVNLSMVSKNWKVSKIACGTFNF